MTCFVENYYCLNHVSEGETKFTSFPGWQEKMRNVNNVLTDCAIFVARKSSVQATHLFTVCAFIYCWFRPCKVYTHFGNKYHLDNRKTDMSIFQMITSSTFFQLINIINIINFYKSTPHKMAAKFVAPMLLIFFGLVSHIQAEF